MTGEHVNGRGETGGGDYQNNTEMNLIRIFPHDNEKGSFVLSLNHILCDTGFAEVWRGTTTNSIITLSLRELIGGRKSMCWTPPVVSSKHDYG